MESLISLDQELFLYLNSLGNSFFDPFWLFVTHKLSWIPLYALLLYLLYKNLGLQKMIVAIIVVGIMITITDQFSYYIKHWVMRLRPCNVPDFEGIIRNITRCGSYGYFSGHATSSFALAVYLGAILKGHYKYIFPILLIWASFVAYSRIYVGVHYPGDVITGSIVGIAIALFCYKLYLFGCHRFVKN